MNYLSYLYVCAFNHPLYFLLLSLTWNGSWNSIIIMIEVDPMVTNIYQITKNGTDKILVIYLKVEEMS